MSDHRRAVLALRRVRTLKIEADGDFWKDFTKPKIRLVGRWLERAGFSSGSYVHVSYIAPRDIKLRCSVAVTEQWAE